MFSRTSDISLKYNFLKQLVEFQICKNMFCVKKSNKENFRHVEVVNKYFRLKMARRNLDLF